MGNVVPVAQMNVMPQNDVKQVLCECADEQLGIYHLGLTGIDVLLLGAGRSFDVRASTLNPMICPAARSV
ncbi:MAG: hypothetical protein PHW13_13200 [Methylococcales bacterium]|nr:hypothetical protein [Methylococcales bacterium]